MSTKFQITLPEELAARMKLAAAGQGKPLAQFIRETMEEKLRRLKSPAPGDPFAWMDGLAGTDDADLASRADEILYGDAGIR